VLTDDSGLSPFERLLTVFTRIRPGEGRSTFLFFLHGFLLLFSYYIVKALREAFILTEFSAEVRAYGVAVIALVLMFVVPAYSAVRRRLDGARLLQAVTVFFAVNMLGFAAAAYFGISTSFTFYVWVSIFGVMIIAQFWAFAADTFNLKSGQRLFPVIMMGANLGALAGAKFAQMAVAALQPVGLMFVATLVLAATLAIARPARAHVPEGSRSLSPEHGAKSPRLLGGIELVLRDRYLLMVALFVVLLNWINTTGEFVLADMVTRDADAQVAASAGAVSKGEIITAFYGDFQFWFTLIGLVIQLLLVARVYRWVGIQGALLVLPVVAALGYGLIVFVPIFSIIRLVKIAENSVNYSLMNTTRHALFLPVDRDAKYEGKTAIDTFFWRFGDLIQAGVVFAGLNWLDWTATNFALLNLGLAMVWIGLAFAIGREFRALAQRNVTNVPPEVGQPIPDLLYAPGQPFRHLVPDDAFRDADPGDVLNLTARLAGGEPLPRWVQFDARRRAFQGTCPEGYREEVTIEVVASDVDGTQAASVFVMRRAVRAG
jgi:ATP:ADP antiporter, AAA family